MVCAERIVVVNEMHVMRAAYEDLARKAKVLGDEAHSMNEKEKEVAKEKGQEAPQPQ